MYVSTYVRAYKNSNKHHHHHHTSAVVTAHGSADRTVSGSSCACQSVVVKLSVWLDNRMFSGLADASRAPMLQKKLRRAWYYYRV